MNQETAKAVRDVLTLCRENGVTVEDLLEVIDMAVNKIPETRESECQQSLEMKISEIFREIGIPAHIKGYNYARAAIIYGLENPTAVQSVTKVLYPEIAKEFATTPARVERAIRHAIDLAWERGNRDILASHFGYTIDLDRGKPTNSEFVAMIVEEVRLSQK